MRSVGESGKWQKQNYIKVFTLFRDRVGIAHTMAERYTITIYVKILSVMTRKKEVEHITYKPQAEWKKWNRIIWSTKDRQKEGETNKALYCRKTNRKHK